MRLLNFLDCVERDEKSMRRADDAVDRMMRDVALAVGRSGRRRGQSADEMGDSEEIDSRGSCSDSRRHEGPEVVQPACRDSDEENRRCW